MTGEVFLTVICGDGSRLCHGDDVSASRDRRGSMRVQEFLRGVLWSCLNNRRGKGVAGCRGLWNRMMEPDWFTMLIPSRPSGFSCSWVELPLLTYPWLLTCSRVACCLARAHACGIEPSWPLAKHFRSHSRTRQFDSARTSGFCNSAALSICCDAIKVGLPPPSVLRCASNPRRITPALTTLPLRSCSF
jgi:hypothetical protein